MIVPNILTIISLCVNSVLAIMILNSNSNTSVTQEKLFQCAIAVANDNFDYRHHTAVFYRDVEDELVNRFIKDYEGSVIIEIKRDAAPPKQVVVIIDSFHSFVKIVTKLKPDLRGKTLLSSGANFLIVILSNPKRLERIMSFLWNYYVLNVVIITVENENRISLYTYYPYKNHLHCQNTQPSLLTHWNETKRYVDLYPDKMRNMRGCPLYIATNKLYDPSTELKIPLQIIKKAIIRLLRDSMNFTPIISMKDYVSIESDRAKNWSLSLSDVISGMSNISISTVPLGVDKMGFLDYSIPYFRVRLAWIAPPPSPGPVWWKLLWPLNGYLWLFIMSVTFFVKILPLISKLKPVKQFCRRHFRKFDKLHGVSLRSWAIMMGQPIRLAPKRFRDFYIISLWMWFTFVVRSAYQSVLIVALKTDAVIGKFENLKEAVDYGYKLGGRAGILIHFEHDPLIRDAFEIVPEDRFDMVFKDVVNGESDFVLATSLEYAWASCLTLGNKEDACGQLITDSIMTVPLVVWMKSHSPFVRPLTVWLPRFIESGLLERDVVLNPTFRVVKSSEESPLIFQQMASCFLCLFLGVTVSAIVFAFEIFWGKVMIFFVTVFVARST